MILASMKAAQHTEKQAKETASATLIIVTVDLTHLRGSQRVKDGGESRAELKQGLRQEVK